MNATEKICTFYISNQLFGIAATSIQEILQDLPITVVPNAPPAIRGLINLRGQIIVAFDLGHRVGFARTLEDATSTPFFNVIALSSFGRLCLLVDRVGDVLDIDIHQFEAPPISIPLPMRTWISGVYKVNGELLTNLNLNLVVDLKKS